MPVPDILYMQTDEIVSEPPQRRRRSTSNDCSFGREGDTGEKVSVLIAPGDGKSKVRFYRFSSVILIPSRVEYRTAECDLWWNRDDFVAFQQSASSELRMLCNIDNVGVREARRRLYQPEFAKDAERRRLNDLGGDYSGDSISRSSSSTLFSLESDEPEDKSDDQIGFLTSVSHSPSKLSLQVFQSAGNLASLVHDTTSEQDFDIIAIEKLRISGSLDDSASPTPPPHFWNLHLCVPLKPFTVPLILEPVHSSHHSLRNARRGNRDDNGFLTVMGFCSFALPIVGYLLFNNSKFSLFQAFS